MKKEPEIELREILDKLRDPTFGEQLRTAALYQKARYDAFVAAGFTPAQALELCRTL